MEESVALQGARYILGGDMRTVIYKDRRGDFHASLVRDSDPDSAAEMGIPLEPPDFGLIDWKEVQRELRNHLIQKQVFNWRDVQREQKSITAAVLSVIRRRIVALYRTKEDNHNG